MKTICCLLLSALALVGQDSKVLDPPKSSKDQSAEGLMERALRDSQLRAAGRRSQGAEEAPADVTVLTGQELRALGYRTVGAALAGVLGFRDNGDRAYENAGVRGLYILGDQNTRLLILLDGHPLNSPAEVGSSKLGEDFGIPMARIDRIEIIRGPASSLYGNNAFLGVVNVVTLEASASGDRELRAGVAGGSGGLRDLWASLRLPLGKVQIALNAGGFRRSGFTTRFPELSPDPLPAELDKETRQHAYLFVQAPAWSFSAYQVNRTQGLAEAPFDAQVGSPETHYQNRLAFAEFKAEPKWGEFKTLLRLFWDSNLFADRFQYGGDFEGILVNRDQNRSLGGELQARAPLGDQWTLIGGVEQAWHRFDTAASFTGVDNTHPTEVLYRIRKVYGEAVWEPSAVFSFTGGFQHSWLLLDENRTSLVLSPDKTFAPGSFGRISPRLALVWRPLPGDTVKLLYSEGFRNFTLFERFGEGNDPFTLGNPGLRLESLRNLALLWLRDWDAGWGSQLGVSSLRWTDFIHSVPQGDIGASQYQNAADPILATILEAQLRWRSGAWDILAQGAVNRWRQGGMDLDNAAQSQAGLRVIRTAGAWSLAGEWRGVGPRSLAGYGRIPFQSTLRASVRWERGPAYVQLTGEDLLDARPEQWVAIEYKQRRIEGNGRQLRVDLGWRF